MLSLERVEGLTILVQPAVFPNSTAVGPKGRYPSCSSISLKYMGKLVALYHLCNSSISYYWFLLKSFTFLSATCICSFCFCSDTLEKLTLWFL